MREEEKDYDIAEVSDVKKTILLWVFRRTVPTFKRT